MRYIVEIDYETCLRMAVEAGSPEEAARLGRGRVNTPEPEAEPRNFSRFRVVEAGAGQVSLDLADTPTTPPLWALGS